MLHSWRAPGARRECFCWPQHQAIIYSTFIYYPKTNMPRAHEPKPHRLFEVIGNLFSRGHSLIQEITPYPAGDFFVLTWVDERRHVRLVANEIIHVTQFRIIIPGVTTPYVIIFIYCVNYIYNSSEFMRTRQWGLLMTAACAVNRKRWTISVLSRRPQARIY